jgi:hypothetical protein
MNLNKIQFSKYLNSENQYYNFINETEYVINDSNASQLKIINNLFAELEFNSRKYIIKPITNFFILNSFKILEDDIVIGKIDYWGWTWKKPKLKITINSEEQVWIFERYEPNLLKKRANPYKTKLTSESKQINFEIYNELLEVKKIKFKEKYYIKGTAIYGDNDKLVCLIGIFLNELLVFDEMEK